MRKLPLLLLVAVSLPVAAQTPYLVKDINTTYSRQRASSSPSEFAAFGGRTFFAATTDAAGTELWSTDGTSAGTAMVADIIPGAGSSSPSALQAVNGVLLFNARDVNHGIELWTTDGSAAGTHLLIDINPGPTSGQPAFRIVYKNRMLFSADDGTNGRELWTTDGTAGGTRLLKDINPGSASGNPAGFILFGDSVYFFAVGGLWKTDGTDAGTVKVASISGRSLAVSGSQLFFEGFTSATSWELWVSDGSDSGTHMVTEILPGTKGALDSNFSLFGFTPFRNGVLFPANDGVHGREMWFSDGTAAGTRMVRDFVPGAAGMWDTSYAYITAFGNRAYFLASDVDHGSEVWSTDATDAGTALFADLVPGTQSSFPSAFTVTGGKLYFVGGGTSLLGPLLWVTDGTASGTQAVSTAFGVGYNFGRTTVLWPVSGSVFFSGATVLTGEEPWVSDGTVAGSHLIANLAADRAPSSDPFTLTAAGNLLFFNATDGTSGIAASLWRTDGTAAGTLKLTENGEYAEPMRPAAGPLVFFLSQADSHTLMMSDGTRAGTKPADDFMRRFGQFKLTALFPFGDTLFAAVTVPDIYATTALWRTTAPDGTATELGARNPFGMIDWAGHYAFYADAPRGAYYYGLWITDGTTAGTYAVIPDLGDTRGEKPSPLVNANGTLFFLKAVDNGKLTLWKSDGTADGTVAVKELPATSAFTAQIKAAGNNVFFYSAGSLWFSDGTDAGTIELTKVTLFSSYENDDLRVAGNRIVYLNNPSSDTWELWGSDGTKAGTKLLKSLGSNYTALTSIDGVVYFSGSDDAHGSEIWTTDGTVEGTKLFIDVNPGPASSSPGGFTKAGNLIYFAAYTDGTGGELWALPVTAPALSIAGAHGTEGDASTALMHFNVSLSPAATQTVTVDYATSDGTAKAGDDYDAASGTITFAPGETLKTIDVRVRGDVAPENNETFFVTLRNANGASLVTQVGAGVIDDDDQFADLSVVSRFSNDGFGMKAAAIVSNAGPRAATDVIVALSITPSNSYQSSARCFNCAIPQLSTGATDSTTSYDSDTSQQMYASATATARQRDPQSSNNTTSWTVNAFRTLAMNAAYLTPGATATVSAGISTQNPNPAVTSSDPSVVAVPSAVTKVTATLATFAVTALKPGTSTISVQGNPYPILVTVVSAGTQPRWPGAVSIATDFTVLALDQPLIVVVVPSGTAPFTAARATGTLVVTAGGRELARTTINGSNTIKFPVYMQSVGSVPYVISYSGDANFLPQTVNGTAFVNLGRVTVTGGLERVPGAAGTYTLTVRTAGSPVVAPTGTLSILNGGVEIAKVTLVPSGGGISTSHATLTNLPVSPTLTMNYSGDVFYQSGSQQVRVVEPRQRSARH
jgi:ELWxxDGT repeat protein